MNLQWFYTSVFIDQPLLTALHRTWFLGGKIPREYTAAFLWWSKIYELQTDDGSQQAGVSKVSHVYCVSYSIGTRLASLFLRAWKWAQWQCDHSKERWYNCWTHSRGFLSAFETIKDGSILQITLETTGGPCQAAEGTYIPGGLEIPCIYHLFGPQEKKKTCSFGN